MSEHLGEIALQNAIASYHRNREIYLRKLAKEMRDQRERAEREAPACSNA